MSQETMEPIPKSRFRNWEPVRKAFFEEAERPSYAELSERFCIPLNSVSTIAADEGWALLRAKKMELALAEADVSQALVSAAKGERLVTDKFRDLALVMIAALLVELGQPPAKQRARLAMFQTISFTVLNLAQSLKAVGIVGLPKELRDRLDQPGSDGDGFRGALAQVNLMVQGGSVSVSTGKVESQQAAVSVQDKLA